MPAIPTVLPSQRGEILFKGGTFRWERRAGSSTGLKGGRGAACPGDRQADRAGGRGAGHYPKPAPGLFTGIRVPAITPRVAHQAHERGPELARRPAIPDARRSADPFKHLPDVPLAERGAKVSGEYQPGVLPSCTGQEPLTCLAVTESAEPLHRHLGKAERAA